MKEEATFKQKSLQVQKRIIEDCVYGRLSTKEASLKLGIQQRSVRRKVARYKKEGEKSLVHGSIGKPHPTRNYKEYSDRIKQIFSETKTDDGQSVFTGTTYVLMTRLLREYYNIKVSPPFVKKILNDIGYYTPYKHSCKKQKIHLYRERRESFGELVQTDATPFNWFGGKTLFSLHAFIDDATGIPLGFWITKNECLLGYIEAFRRMALQFGLPQSIYSDRTQIFFISRKNEDGYIINSDTQFGKMMKKMGIELIPAYSPQGKGRIERFWWTLQNQLPVLFKVNNVNSVETANEYLNTKFISWFSKIYAVKPVSECNLFVKADISDINRILKAVFYARTDKGGGFSFGGYKFICEFVSQKIKICLSESQGMWIEKMNDNSEKRYNVRLLSTDSHRKFAEVHKILIEKTFLQDAKSKCPKDVYFELDAKFQSS